ncbi:uncharacterized protein Dwil_GK20390 [Drosophila willistoni]|nr:uncharacterized protein LOC6645724 [Drosophila willistoni]EDW79479.2 uncharacterized protein Dwil_GK20390 [Drosophila willistoni]
MRYSKQVLVGNWLDRRNSIDGQSNAILPGLKGPQGCEHHRTLSQDTYTDVAFTGNATIRDFEEQRMMAFENYRRGTSASVHFIDNEALKDNYTTLNTLIFGDLLKPHPKAECQNPAATAGHNMVKRQSGKHKREIDLMQSFGNQARVQNIAKQIRYQELHEKINSMQTTYSSSYNRVRKNDTVFEFGPDYDGVVKFDIVC